MINFVDIINILKATGYDSFGEVSEYVADVGVPCKIMDSYKHEELESTSGSFVKVKAKIYLEGLYQIGFDDKVSFTDDFGREYELEILAIKAIKNFQDVIEYTRVTV